MFADRPLGLPGGWSTHERGVVTVLGERIDAVDPPGKQTPDIDLGNAAILPGLVNAHTHLDLSGLRGKCPPSPDFVGWLRQVIAHRRTTTPEQTEADIHGLAECLRFGTTVVGDIASGGASWDALAEAPLWAVVYFELLGLSQDRAAAAWEVWKWWLRARPEATNCRPGVSPHAPYSARFSLFFGAATADMPAATHLAESREELWLLGDRCGPFVDFLKGLGVWDPEGLAEGPDHILRLMNGLRPVVFCHGNYLRPDHPIPDNAAVVYCPRTHAAFGHPAHPFRDFLARGVCRAGHR